MTCCEKVSNASARTVINAPIDVKWQNRVCHSRRKLSHAPRELWSMTSSASRALPVALCFGAENQVHFAWLIAAATGTSSAARVTVDNIATRPFRVRWL